MLEMRLLAFCACGLRVPCGSHGTGVPNSRWWIITIVESYFCRIRRNKYTKIILLRKNRGATSLRAIMLLTFSLSIKALRMSRYVKLARNSSRIRTYVSIRLKVALESALTPKGEREVSPRSVFLP
jgi:hypothetical protein